MSFASCSVSAAVGSSMTRMRARPGERAGDLDDPLLGDRQALHLRIGADRAEAELVEKRPRLLAHRPVVDDAEARSALQRQVGERDVFRHGHVAHDGNFLRQQPHAGSDRRARIGEDDLLAVHLHRPGVARVDAGQDFHERRLAGAVRAEQRHHLARRDRQVHIVEHGDAAERFADAAHFKARRRSAGRCHADSDTGSERFPSRTEEIVRRGGKSPRPALIIYSVGMRFVREPCHLRDPPGCVRQVLHELLLREWSARFPCRRSI